MKFATKELACLALLALSSQFGCKERQPSSLKNAGAGQPAYHRLPIERKAEA